MKTTFTAIYASNNERVRYVSGPGGFEFSQNAEAIAEWAGLPVEQIGTNEHDEFIDIETGHVLGFIKREIKDIQYS